MNHREIAELYRLVRRRKPAAAMMFHAVGAMVVLLAWAAVAPINEIVTHRVKIVPSGGAEGNAGALNPSSPVGGIVAEIVATESSWVERGDLLLRFDNEELLLRREGELKKQEGIRRELEARHWQIQLANSSYDARTSELVAQKTTEEESTARRAAEQKIEKGRAEAELRRATSELDRGEKLQKSRAISKSELEALRSAKAAAAGGVELARLPLSTAKIKEIEKRIESLDSEHAQDIHLIEAEKTLLKTKLEAVANEVALLDLKIEQCSIRAPKSGVVSLCTLRRGDWVPPGEVGITISQEGFVAEAILPSRLICDVNDGSRARVTLDGVDWLIHGSLTAKVTKVAPDLRKEESVLGDGSTEVVDGFRVLLKFEPNEEFKKWDSIRLGMTGLVEIDVGNKKLATYLLEKAIGTEWISKK